MSSSTKFLDRILSKGKEDPKVKSFSNMLSKLVKEKGSTDTVFNENFRTLCDVALIVHSSDSGNNSKTGKNPLLSDLVTYVHSKTKKPKGRLDLISGEALKKASSTGGGSAGAEQNKKAGALEDTTSTFGGSSKRGKRARDEVVPASLILQQDGTSRMQLLTTSSQHPGQAPTTGDGVDLGGPSAELTRMATGGSTLGAAAQQATSKMQPWDVSASDLRKSGAVFDRVELEVPDPASTVSFAGTGAGGDSSGNNSMIPKVLVALTQSPQGITDSIRMWTRAQNSSALLKEGHLAVSGLTINAPTSTTSATTTSAVGPTGGSPLLKSTSETKRFSKGGSANQYQAKSFVPAADSGTSSGKMKQQQVDPRLIQNICQVGIIAAYQ